MLIQRRHRSGGAVCVKRLIWLTALIMQCAPLPARAQEPSAGWPHRRGPHYSGVSDDVGLADSWPTEGPPVVWTRGLGQGYSALIAVGDRVYTQYQDVLGQYLVCLGADTGKLIWQHRYAHPYDPLSVYPGPRATPTLHNGRIYFAGPLGEVGCVDAATGAPAWMVNVNERFHGKGTEFGNSCSPLIEEELVILPVGGTGAAVVALHAANGETAWAAGDEPASYCSAVPVSLGKRRIIVTLLQNALCGFDLQTGEVLWELAYSHGYDEHSADPIYREPYLLISGPFKSGATLYRLVEAADDPTPSGLPRVRLKLAWQAPRFSNDVASSLLWQGHVYGFDLRDAQTKAHRASRGEFRCLDFATGAIRWSTDRVGHATSIAADGKLFLFNDSGEVILARADPAEYVELGRGALFGDEICWTPPTLNQGRLFLRTQSKAACLYVGRPEALPAEARETFRPTIELAQARDFDYTLLAGGEREHPFVRPDAQELTSWYLLCLGGVFLPSAVLAAIAHGLGRWRPLGRLRGASRVVYWSSAFGLGLILTPLANRYSSEFLLTWPATIYVAFQLCVRCVVWSQGQTHQRRIEWLCRSAVLGLIGVCAGYFFLCRRLSMPHEWAFLIGMFPGFPPAVWAARRMQRHGKLLCDVLCGAVAFTGFFWGGGGFLLMRTWLDG